MIEIKLTRGYSTIVDDEDADLANISWDVLKSPTNNYATDGYKSISLHRVILARKLKRELTKDEEADHIDRNGLNNTRANLRLATKTQNKWNTPKRNFKNRKLTSKYKGVYQDTITKRRKRWLSSISYGNKRLYIGSFLTEKEAALAYNEKANELHGEFAYLNIMEEK